MEIKLKKRVWIYRPHPGELDEYICSICGAVLTGPQATCPCCRTYMLKPKGVPMWIDASDYRDPIPAPKKGWEFKPLPRL